MYDNVFKIIRTQDDVLRIREDLELLHAGLFKSGEGSYDQVLKTAIRADLSTAIQEDLKISNQSQQVFIEGIISELKKVKRVELSIAFHPSEAALLRIIEWVRAQVGQGTVVDLKYDPNLVGGAVVVFNGRYKDYSIRKRLQTFYATRMGELVGLLS